MAINHIIVSGNAGKDFETRQTNAGKTVGSFSVAATQGFGDYKKTSWLTVRVLNDGFSRFLAERLKKGMQVVVSGEFVLEKWDSNGVEKTMPTIIAKEVVINAPASASGGSNNNAGNGGGWGQPQQPGGAGSQNGSGSNGNQAMDFDDDIPF